MTTRQVVSTQAFKIDQLNDLVAFIDEAGDEGFADKSSRWFVVSSIAIPYQDYQRARQLLNQYITSFGKKKTNFGFKNLNHVKRKDWTHALGQLNYYTVHSVFHKFELTSRDKYLSTYPSMYFVGVKNNLERLSWLTQQLNKNRIHIMIGKRNNISHSAMHDYLYEASVHANKNMCYFNRLGTIVLGSIQDEGILLADSIASSMFQALEPMGLSQLTETSYFDFCIKDHLYSSNHRTRGGIWTNGLKCTPTDKKYFVNSSLSILAEGASSS